MSRVEINADGRHVVVDHVGDLPYLMEKALDTWKATEKAKLTRGFVQGTQPRYSHIFGCAEQHEPNEPCPRPEPAP